MRTQRDYYEIMGLERTASTDEIKRKYRELARRYHPDVVQDDGMNQKIFIQITHAYKTLVDPEKRLEYDRVLRNGGDAFSASASGMSQASQPGVDEYYYPTSPQVDALLRQAETAFSRNQMGEAADLCKRALDIERANPRTHALLGDIYHGQNRIGAAMSEYSYAILYNPGDLESKQKLNKLKKIDTKNKRGRPKRRSAPPPQRPAAPPTSGNASAKPSNGGSAPKAPSSASRSSSQETGGSILDKLKTLFKR